MMKRLKGIWREGAVFIVAALCVLPYLAVLAAPTYAQSPQDTSGSGDRTYRTDRTNTKQVDTGPIVPTITLDVSGADVRDVLSAMASNFKVNVALPPDLAGTVTVVLKDIGLREALKAVLEPLGYEWEMRESVIYVQKKGEGARLYVNFDAGKVTLDAQKAPLQEVARLLSTKTSSNVVADEAVRDVPVSISIKDITLGDGLKLLAQSHKLGLTEKGGAFYFKKAAAEDAEEVVRVDSDGKVAVKAQKAEITAVMTEMAAKTGVSIGIEQGVSGQVTADLKDMAAADAIGTLAELAGLAVEERAGVYQVFKPLGAGGTARGKPAFKVEYVDGLVTLDVSKGDLGEVINAIIQKSGLDFVVYGTIRDQIDARMDSKPLEVAMSTLLQGTRYSFRKLDNGVYIIGDKTQAAPTSASLTDAEVIELKNIPAEDVLSMIPPSIPTSGLKPLKDMNAIAVQGSPEDIAAVRKYIEKIDMEPTVIEVAVTAAEISEEVSRNIDLSSTLKGSAPNKLEVTPGKLVTELDLLKINLNDNLQAALNALVSEGKASVVVKPKTAVISGQEATFDVTKDEFFKVTTGNVQTPLTTLEKVASGVRLIVKPWASSSSEKIRMSIKAEVSSPAGVSAEGLPAISGRKTSTIVSLEEGQTLVVSGLYQERETTSEDRFPYLGKIPVLGYAFKKEKKAKNKNELIFYVTPRIVSKKAKTAETSMEVPSSKEKQEALKPIDAPIKKSQSK